MLTMMMTGIVLVAVTFTQPPNTLQLNKGSLKPFVHQGADTDKTRSWEAQCKRLRRECREAKRLCHMDMQRCQDKDDICMRGDRAEVDCLAKLRKPDTPAHPAVSTPTGKKILEKLPEGLAHP